MTLDGLAARSVAVIRAYQDESGAYLAAPFPAQYRNAWLRDGAFVADAMSQAPALFGTPEPGHCSSAATSASCARSSASPTS